MGDYDHHFCPPLVIGAHPKINVTVLMSKEKFCFQLLCRISNVTINRRNILQSILITALSGNICVYNDTHNVTTLMFFCSEISSYRHSGPL